MLAMMAGANATLPPKARRAAGKSTPTVAASRVGITHFASHMDKNPANLARLVIGRLPKWQKFLGGALDEEPATDSSKVALDCDANRRASVSERTVSSYIQSAPIPGNKYSAQVEKATPPRPRPFSSPQMKKWQSTS